jgi:TFIIF-interacting CTD phosphatase-like protein
MSHLIRVAIPVLEFTADKVEKDQELLNLIDTLEELRELKDVRQYLNERYCIKQALEDSKMI